mmetsp:Transcript_33607/g.100184  ORF Transcript_33607/g.100184 Transcript_33607/m.100184 type:complete len:221 (-) Transcript_33607:223-885(-)
MWERCTGGTSTAGRTATGRFGLTFAPCPPPAERAPRLGPCRGAPAPRRWSATWEKCTEKISTAGWRATGRSGRSTAQSLRTPMTPLPAPARMPRRATSASLWTGAARGPVPEDATPSAVTTRTIPRASTSPTGRAGTAPTADARRRRPPRTIGPSARPRPPTAASPAWTRTNPTTEASASGSATMKGAMENAPPSRACCAAPSPSVPPRTISPLLPPPPP